MNEKVVKLTDLKSLRYIHHLTLDEVALKTGLSIGYLNRMERGFITEIKNIDKKKSLEQYIKKLHRRKVQTV